MSIRSLTSVAAAAAFATTLLVPVSALADGAYHPATGELGATYHPQHASATSGSQVAADLEKAQKHPAWNAASRGAPWPVAKSGEPKTRDQVNAELNAAMKDPAWKNVSRGAPWPTVVADPK
ncbi:MULTISPECIES: hypothetical protein [unclassified Variovorax]|uniref:hypothetical protein n=1 Tax=unclassified Variovorax TaxID=663243 RepID=UPI00083910E6|nr:MULTISPECIES: hypothetical protein [unclassified Variovorax]PNG48937.1 hypothetical protein CHC07_06694 [Variovorax sp. B4]PNG49793.1 hypothetical protein CHC06_05374 [Variovorax sp. B2]PNG50640.1 hypothetical protein CHC06_06264 [Variovorax sp. B2]PNG50665.1 hypothetical protein CHC07_05279 [Variovorax sp. B4]VTV17840.1 hypothetical protein WDL1P1_00703 [Variovorax sp. WDL1]